MKTIEEVTDMIHRASPWGVKREILKEWAHEIVILVAKEAAVLSSEEIIGKSLKEILIKRFDSIGKN